MPDGEEVEDSFSGISEEEAAARVVEEEVEAAAEEESEEAAAREVEVVEVVEEEATAPQAFAQLLHSLCSVRIASPARGEIALVSIVLMLSMVVSGLSFVSVAVGANVRMTGTGSSWSWGGRGLSCASRWLDGAAVAVLCGVTCWVAWRQAQSSLMVQQWNAGGAGM